MSPLAVSPPFPSLWNVRQTEATGASARELATQLANIAKHEGSKATDWRQVTCALIEELALECALPGWDGYAARPISPEAKGQAQRFIATLPPDLEAPEPVPDADGEFSLCWDRGPGRTFTVSIAPSGVVSYAGLWGRDVKRCGQESFLGDTPRVIIESLRDLYASS